MRRLLLAAVLIFSALQTVQAQQGLMDTDSPAIRRRLNAAAVYLERYPEYREYILPPDFTPARAAAEIVLEYRNEENEKVRTRLNSVKTGLVDFGKSLLWKNDKANLIRLYRALYQRLPRKFRSKLDKPQLVSRKSLRQVRNSYNRLSRLVDLNFERLIVELAPGVAEALSINPI